MIWNKKRGRWEGEEGVTAGFEREELETYAFFPLMKVLTIWR